MSIRKFGTSDDQRIVTDEKDQQGLSKSAQRRIDTLTDQDRKELAEENKK
jgi:hypothetical protein